MYKDTYTRTQLGEGVVSAAETLLEGIWSYTKRERIEAIKQFLETVSAQKSMPVPEFEFVEGNDGLRGYESTGGGVTFMQPDGSVKIIMYRKFSITTLLHEFRHAMQLSNVQEAVDRVAELGGDMEEDAREWSCSVYYNADPTRYMKAVQLGRLKFA